MAIHTGDIIRVGAKMLWNLASDIVNVWWLEITDDADLPTEDIISDILEWLEDFYDGLATLMANNVSFSDVTVSNFTVDESYGSWGWPTLTVGQLSGEAISPALGVFCWYPTSTPHVMAKKWFGAFTEANNSDGEWNAQLISAVSTANIGLLTSFTGTQGATLRAVIPHLVSDGQPMVTPQFIPYSTSHVSANPGVQRRRRAGSGG